MYASQHPSDCSNAQFFVTCATPYAGLGADVHFWTMALAAAASHDRVLVFLEDADVMQWAWRDGVECVDGRSDGFKCYFNDLTGCKPDQSELQGLSCRADTYSSASALEAALASDERIVVFGDSLHLNEGHWHGRLPPPFRDDEHTKFEELELYRAVAVEFLFHHPANWLRKLVCDSWSEVYGFEDAPSPDELVTVHIRWGDKHVEMKLLDVEEYAQAVETLQKRHASLQQRMSVFLVTEDESALDAFTTLASRKGWRLFSYGKSLAPLAKEHMASTANKLPERRLGAHSLVSLYLSLHARYYVLTTRSNWSLLIDELRRSRVEPSCGGKCTDVIDLTDPAVGLGFPRRTEWADLRQRVVATQSESQTHFIIGVMSDTLEPYRHCGGCAVLHVLAEQLETLGYAVTKWNVMNLVSERIAGGYSHVQSRDVECPIRPHSRNVVILSEGIIEKCSPNSRPDIMVHWILSPMGTIFVENTTNAWPEDDWVYQYLHHAPKAATIVPDSNLLAVFLNPYPGDEFDIGKSTMHRAKRSGRLWTWRKADLFHKAEFQINGQLRMLHTPTDTALSANFSEAIEQLRGCESFVAYDPYTMWTFIAGMLGCISIVYPLGNMTKKEWFISHAFGPYYKETGDGRLMDGIAYGSEEHEIMQARKHMKYIREGLYAVKEWGKNSVQRLIADVNAYMNKSVNHLEWHRMLVKDYYPRDWWLR
ncbi:hypothetical protein NFJ02_32g81490 [Pycnococcus provasolii]